MRERIHDLGMVTTLYAWFHDLFHRPVRIFWICVVLAGIGVVLDGTAFRLWGLKRDHLLLTERIAKAKLHTKQLGFRIQMAQQPEFIEKAARDQFDLVKEGDLIFIFSDDAVDSADKTAEKSDPATPNY